MTAGTSSCSPVSSIPSTGQGGSQWKQTNKQNCKNLATQESLQRRENSAPQWPGWAGALQGLAIWRSSETGQRAREEECEGRQKAGGFPVPKAGTRFSFPFDMDASISGHIQPGFLNILLKDLSPPSELRSPWILIITCQLSALVMKLQFRSEQGGYSLRRPIFGPHWKQLFLSSK